ncbi:hypothetical protein AUEXF2481DRAFT_33214 [Aureobasidium subglaciale EXF-2481]|uniref:N-acetyltransferase domain-containing protein n=1 Tax=Aureobasidium subglaciale (strain EXF-2481) TaxID=1043005 RepID=A0A074Y0E3_AURSE|nr:uncharacterized protein AUEXF2481DRAFT_33214 [Aureobasidium subglaciale EXF-2481]KAI5198554.1 hypothetical protein E4T38_07459 [Aureobasidium subglaciale]KAI5217303.1 hypothetical protein E4T40_07470 [Aureobasidium subglaciale]KAI5220933.1 hypothetical protein E4T41_07311 [Aureobasidium subglaciale]KAI5258459.1 hypothetical protein E4T46_07288 [Aureobasidium subglaciale]KEQ91263.1 hypothetical protein AUEXF2481DRAFT_33214 [Aureobasidium subglaciale EXF-2481]
MSSIANRRPLRTYSKTYSKRKHQDSNNDTLKRRRVSIVDREELASNPSSDPPPSDFAIFSDENTHPSTPPSSPPCLAVSPRAPPPRMQPLEPLVQKFSSTPQLVPKQNKSLVQMQLNFGQLMRKTCKECRMEYVPSAPEDVALHKKFHAQHTNGIFMDRDFLTKVKSEKAVWHGSQGDFIIHLSGSQDPKHWLKKARAVFDMATTDLGAVDIPDEKLWGSQFVTNSTRKRAVNTKDGNEADRYKLYLYINSGRCVGLCLAEGIDRAFKVIEPKIMGEVKQKDEEETSSKASGTETPGCELLSISEKADEAAVGISRIWTSQGSRKKGIARALLKCVAKTFLSKVTPKDMVAFSQPTEMGTALARRWFGQEYGWHVYID